MIDNKNPSDNKPHDFEEEFDFDSNDLFETGADPLNTVSPNRPSFVERAKWPILIGAIITGFLIWKFYGILFPSTADAQIDKVAAEEAAAIKANSAATTGISIPPPMTPAPAEAVIVMPPPSAPVAVLIPAPSAPVDMRTQDEIKQLENTVNQVMDSLTKMDQKISLIGREFFAVSDQVTKLSQEMAQLRNKPKTAAVIVNAPHRAKKPSHTRPHHAPKKVQPVYSIEQEHDEEILEDGPKPMVEKIIRIQRKANLTIHAIIPGRVWFKAPDGSTFTVTTGENIPGYGKAMVIDAPSASVVTSSGVVLR